MIKGLSRPSGKVRATAGVAWRLCAGPEPSELPERGADPDCAALALECAGAVPAPRGFRAPEAGRRCKGPGARPDQGQEGPLSDFRTGRS